MTAKPASSVMPMEMRNCAPPPGAQDENPHHQAASKLPPREPRMMPSAGKTNPGMPAGPPRAGVGRKRGGPEANSAPHNGAQGHQERQGGADSGCGGWGERGGARSRSAPSTACRWPASSARGCRKANRAGTRTVCPRCPGKRPWSAAGCAVCRASRWAWRGARPHRDHAKQRSSHLAPQALALLLHHALAQAAGGAEHKDRDAVQRQTEAPAEQRKDRPVWAAKTVVRDGKERQIDHDERCRMDVPAQFCASTPAGQSVDIFGCHGLVKRVGCHGLSKRVVSGWWGLCRGGRAGASAWLRNAAAPVRNGVALARSGTALTQNGSAVMRRAGRRRGVCKRRSKVASEAVGHWSNLAPAIGDGAVSNVRNGSSALFRARAICKQSAKSAAPSSYAISACSSAFSASNANSTVLSKAQKAPRMSSLLNW